MAMFLPLAAEAGGEALLAGGAEASAASASGAAGTGSRMLSALQFGKRALGPVANFAQGMRGGDTSSGSDAGSDTGSSTGVTDGWDRA